MAEILELMGDDPASGAKAGLAAASRVSDNPDNYAQNLGIADSTGLPVDVVERNRAEIEKKAALDSLLSDTSLTTGKAAGWLSDKNNAALVQDDFDNLKKLQNGFDTGVFEKVGRSAYAGVIASSAGAYGVLEGAAANIQEYVQNPINEFLGLPLIPNFGTARDTFADLRKGVQATQQAQRDVVKADGIIEKGVYGGIESLAGTLPSMLLSVATGNPVPALASAGITTGGQAIGKALDEGLSPVQATLYGIADGTIEMGTEMLPVAKLIGDLKVGTGFFKTLVHQAALEVPGELTATTLQNLNSWASLRPDQPFSSYLKELPEDLAITLVATMTAVGAQTGVVYGADKALRKSAPPENALAEVDGMTRAVRESKLFQRSPKRFHDLVGSLSADERFYLTHEAAMGLFESLPAEQRDAIFASAPDLKTEFDNTAVTGADVAIRKADYAALIAPLPQADALREHMKLDPADLTIAEQKAMQEFMAANPELAQAVEAQAQEANLPPAAQETYAALERVFRKTFQDAGRPVEEAKAVAPLFARSLARFTSAFGNNALDYLNQNVLGVQQQGENGAISGSTTTQTMLSDLQALRDGKNIKIDDVGRAALERLGQRLDDEGISLSTAMNMDANELLANLFPERQNTVNIEGQDIPLPGVELQQGQDGSISATIKPNNDAANAETVRTLQQRYNQTETPEFKAWFGDSKVVDENGKPLVVYHGTRSVFDAFDLNKSGENGQALGKGFYFTNSRGLAEGYGNVGEFYLSAKNPAFNPTKKTIELAQVKKILAELEKHDEYLLSNYGDIESEGRGPVLKRVLDDVYHTSKDDADVIAAFINLGGVDRDIVMRSVIDITGKDGFVTGADIAAMGVETTDKVYVVLLPTQIKSATGNRGTFDPNDPRILYQRNSNYREILESQRQHEGMKAAVRDPETGKIYTGWSHFEATENAKKDGSEAYNRVWKEHSEHTENDGFIKSGKFISREDADKQFSISSMEDIYLNQPERGSITFSAGDYEQRLKKVIIAFTSRANFSTAVHEFSHWAVANHRLFAQLARERIAAGDTDLEIQRIANDWETLKKEVGATSDDFTVEQEEKAAAMFEAYMREGKAPSESLRRVFTRFRDWLTKIYRDLSGLGNIKLNDEVRGIFNRWLASEDEIARVQGKNNTLADTAVALGLPPEIIDTVADYVNSAVMHGEEAVYKELTREQKRLESEAYQAEFDKTRAPIAADVAKQREYQVVNSLKESGLHIFIDPAAQEVGLPDNAPFSPDMSEPVDYTEYDRLVEEEADAQAIRDSLINALLAPPPKKPEGLIDFLVSKGGLNEKLFSGEMQAIGISNKERRGIINNKSGQDFDTARASAVEAGFLPEDADINALIEAIRRDHEKGDVFRSGDYEYLLDLEAYQRNVEAADRLGINIERERLKRQKYGRYADLFTDDEHHENAIRPDVVAELFNFDSGSALITALRRTRDFDRLVNQKTREALARKYPDSLRDGMVGALATPAILNDRVLLALDVMIKELGRMSNVNRAGMKQFARVMAQQQISRMKIGEASYAFRHEVQRERNLKAALQAARSGKPDEALTHLQKAMVSQTIYKQLQDVQEMREKAEKLFRRVNANDKELAAGTDIDFVGAARGLLYRFGLARQDFNVQQWLADIAERDPDMVNDMMLISKLSSADAKPAKDLTIPEFMELYNGVKNAMWMARKLREFELGDKKLHMADIRAQLIETMSEVEPAARIEGTQVYGKAKIRNIIMGIKATVRRMEHWALSMDGGKAGAFSNFLFRPVSEAGVAYREARQHWLTELEGILAKHKERLTQSGKIDSGMVKGDGKLIFRDRLELIGFMLHTGNSSNLEKLLGGYGIEASSYQEGLAQMQREGVLTKQDYVLVQELWDLAEGLKPLSQKAHKQLYGYRFDEVEYAPILTPFGVFRGGYWPAIVDYEQVDSKAAERAVAEQSQFMLPATNKGFTKRRSAGYKKPLNTSLKLASQHIDQVLRFVHIEPAVSQVRRVVFNDDFKDALKAIDSGAYSGTVLPFLHRAAAQTTVETSKGRRKESAARFIRSSASAQAMMLNLLNAVQNLTSLPMAAYKVGNRNFAKALVQFTAHPFESMNQIRDLSQQMRVRHNVQDIDLSNHINDIVLRRGYYTKLRNISKKHGYVFQRLLQGYVDNVTWLAAYNQSLADGAVEADAVKYADSIVRTTQGSLAPEDVSAVEAGTDFEKLFLMFYSYFNNVANFAGTEARTIMRKQGYSGAPQLFYLYMMTAAIPLFTAELLVKSLKGDLPGDEDDDGTVIDDWLAWFAGSQFRGVAAAVPYAGQALNALINSYNDKPLDDRISASPALSFADTAVRFVSKATQGEYTDESQAVRDGLNAIGFLVGLPLGQLGKPLGYIADVHEGESRADTPAQVMRGLIGGPIPSRQ